MAQCSPFTLLNATGQPVQQQGGWWHPQMRDYLRACNSFAGVVAIARADSAGEVIYYVEHTPPPPNASRQWHTST